MSAAAINRDTVLLALAGHIGAERAIHARFLVREITGESDHMDLRLRTLRRTIAELRAEGRTHRCAAGARSASRAETAGVRQEPRGYDSYGSPRRGSHPTASLREDPAPPLGATASFVVHVRLVLFLWAHFSPYSLPAARKGSGATAYD